MITKASTPLNLVWLSLEQGMQSRSDYFQYAMDRALSKSDLKEAVHSWGPATVKGPGNFHLPDHLDDLFKDFIAFENMFTPSTATAMSLMGGFTGVPHMFHALIHTAKADVEIPVTLPLEKDITLPTIFSLLDEQGYNVSGFHIFFGSGPGFILPDFKQGCDPEIESWPHPIPSHVNYVTPAARLENHLNANPEGPHAICVHAFAQTTPAILEILTEHGINRDNTIFVVAGDHGHPNWDKYGKEWVMAHDIECDQMNTHVYCRFSYPKCRTQSVSMACTTLDFFPTIKSLMGMNKIQFPELEEMQGVNLVPFLESETPPSNLTERTIHISNRYHFQLKSRISSIRDSSWRYQYMHKNHIFLNDELRLKEIANFQPETLYRSVGNGFENEVNISNPIIQGILKRFRSIRIKSDMIIQRFWLKQLRAKIYISNDVDQILNDIDPDSSDLPHQIKLSNQIDSIIAGCIEKHIKRPIDLLNELRRMVTSDFYYNHVIPNYLNTVSGRVAIWGTGDHYNKYIRPNIDRINAYCFIEEDETRRQQCLGSSENEAVLDGLPVFRPDALKSIDADTILICVPPEDFISTAILIRSMNIARSPTLG